MELHQVLREVGLTNKEAPVYMAVLKLGESTVLPIAKKAGLKRTYCYDILSDLVEKGLVSFVVKSGRRRYKAEDPKKIANKLNNNVILFDSILPQLYSLYNNSFLGKPKVSFYEGIKEIASIYKQLVGVTQLDAIGSPTHINTYLSKYLKPMVERIVTKRTKIRELLPQKSPQAFYHKYYVKPYHEYRFLPTENEFNTDMMLFENKLVLISYGETPHAVVIEDSNIVETQRILFEIIWQKVS